MAGLPPLDDPVAQAQADAAAAAAALGGAAGLGAAGVGAGAAGAGAGGGAGGGVPGGNPLPPLVAMPLASPGAISRAIWSKVPEAEHAAFSTTEMRTYGLVMQGNYLDPDGATVLWVSTGAAEPKCFLISRMHLATAIPKIELIHSMGSYLVALGQPDNLHGHTFAFVGEQIGDRLPSTYLEPDSGRASLAFQPANVVVPT